MTSQKNHCCTCQNFFPFDFYPSPGECRFNPPAPCINIDRVGGGGRQYPVCQDNDGCISGWKQCEPYRNSKQQPLIKIPDLSHYESGIDWFTSGDTGISSQTLVTIALGRTPEHGCFSSHPHDPSDLGRCIRMLEKLPWVKEPAFSFLTANGSQPWKNLIWGWDKIEQLYHEESKRPDRMAPATYDLMKKLIAAEGGI